jgi:hypothetical protein
MHRSQQWRPLLFVALLGVSAALVLPSAGIASAFFGDKSVRSPSLAVTPENIAIVSYTTSAGVARHVLVWGALNANPHPTDPASAQQAFQFDYSGGARSRANPGYWKLTRDVCKPYRGPPLVWLVAACTAPDGSHWALQRWQRNLPMRGFTPWTAAQRAVELHISHWSGPLPTLEIYQDFTYGAANQGFFGRLMYHGQPVFGARTSSQSLTDSYSRNVYIDTFNSDFGSGWKHDTAITTHPGSGAFCYTFAPQPPPLGYPTTEPNGNGLGERYRVTAIGPGVTPVIQWVGARLTAPSQSAQTNALRKFEELLGGDRHCAVERPS